MNKRSYKQQCALARALDLVGERWTFLIIRELIIAPKRYKTLGENLKGMGTNLLATRLKELEAATVIERVNIPDSKLQAYQLTPFGRELEEPVLAIIRWGFKLSINADEEADYLSVSEWDLVAMKAAFRPELAKGLEANVYFDVKDNPFFMTIKNQVIDIRLENQQLVDISLTTSIKTLMQIDAGILSFEQAVAKKQLQYKGDKALLIKVLDVCRVGSAHA